MCGDPCGRGYPFQFGLVNGFLCHGHALSCDAVVGVWARKVVSQQSRQRAKEAKAAARMTNELLPVSVQVRALRKVV
jgi:hypothetical protein